MLKKAIRSFAETRDEASLFRLLMNLRDSTVWIPCNAVVGETDRKTVEQMIEEAGDDLDSMAGKKFTAQEDIRFIPDILQKGDEFLFQVFSSEKEMGEYGEHFSKIEESFLQVLELAGNVSRDDSGLAGIVVNAFTEPFVLVKELFDAVKRMPSGSEDQ